MQLRNILLRRFLLQCSTVERDFSLAEWTAVWHWLNSAEVFQFRNLVEWPRWLCSVCRRILRQILEDEMWFGRFAT